MRYALAVLWLALAACEHYAAKDIGGGMHRLEYASPLGSDDTNASVLSWRASEICPAGWTKLSESEKPGAADGPMTIWEIRCR